VFCFGARSRGLWCGANTNPIHQTDQCSDNIDNQDNKIQPCDGMRQNKFVTKCIQHDQFTEAKRPKVNQRRINKSPAPAARNNPSQPGVTKTPSANGHCHEGCHAPGKYWRELLRQKEKKEAQDCIENRGKISKPAGRIG
jgi:hypothetical protein